VLIFRLACQHERLYEPPPAGSWMPSFLLPPHEQEARRRDPEPNLEFFAAINDDFTSATGWIYSGMEEQLCTQERQWRDNFKSPGTNTENYPELSDSARAWIEIADKKLKARDLTDAARNANHRALAEEDAEDPDLVDNEDPPNDPMSMPQTKSVQKWPPTRPVMDTPYSPRTPSESPSRGRKRRRRCSTPRSERSIESSNERRRSSTPRRDTISVKVLEDFIKEVNDRLSAREARLDRFEESLVRSQEAMLKQVNKVMEMIRSQVGPRPDPTAPTQESAPAQES
jgi:hypothetical protein